MPNGSIDAHDDGSRVSELQELLDRTNKELAESRKQSAALNARMAELEVELANARRELSRNEELSIKQQREQREVRSEHGQMRVLVTLWECKILSNLCLQRLDYNFSLCCHICREKIWKKG